MNNLFEYQDIPNNISFWRKGDPIRWHKSSSNEVFHLGDSMVHIETDFNGELVLVHPTYCTNCWFDSDKHPPSKVCHNCGQSSEIRENLETMKRAIEDWTGKRDAHI
ncbi:MAG TPA: hypothetical protein VF691_21520 [Cytophagaceae bacterium]|jgi:predicted Zn-ribbon and HTH transcriptional regulator